ncbi:transposase [Methanobrevibacter olleyae]|nr:transposase [Methanobrevibacter olleyae]
MDHPKKSELIALDGTGHTNDYADKYYAQIRAKKRKRYTKNHIAIDVDTRMILHYGVSRGPKHDTQFALAAIRQTKKYQPHYFLADRAYDSEEIRKCINEETLAFEQIPLKTRAKNGHYRLNSSTIFRPKIYSRRMNVESVIFVIKQIFSGINFSRNDKLRNKETKLKDVLYNFYRHVQIF